MKRFALIPALLVLLLLLGSSPSQATVSGKVTDTVNHPVPGALVTFTNETIPDQYFSTYTDSLGRYQIDFAPDAVEETPAPFSLGQNYPNPFNPSTTIPFTLDAPGNVTLTIYNIMGQSIRTLVNDQRDTGQYTVTWDACDDRGKQVGAGIYLYLIRCNGRAQVRKMLLMDGGGLSGGMYYPRHEQRSAKQASGENTKLYTVTVERFGYSNHRQENIDVTLTTTLNFKLQDSGELVTIPGGTFQMGNMENASEGDSDEKPVHTVTLSGFEMSIYEITNAQYVAYLNAAKASGAITATSESVKGAKGAYSGQKYIYLVETYPYYPQLTQCWIIYNNNTFSVVSGHENWPVVRVTWYGAKAFALYYGLDLPTESEWEYACRGGMQYKYGTDDGTISRGKANYWDYYSLPPMAVGRCPANPYGLYDMSGNVWEWCHDWYGTYPSGSVNNPTGAQSGYNRVIRGGGWYSDVYECRSAGRSYSDPGNGYFTRGFRVVRRVSPQNY